MGAFLIMAGFAVNFVCGVWLLVKAFKVSVGWGLAVMFLPFAGLFFVINHWNDTKQPFLGGIAGLALIVLGVIAAPSPEPETDAAESQVASRGTRSAPINADGEVAPTNYASAAAPAYDPPRNNYRPASTYTPAYNPPPPAASQVKTDTQAIEDEWSRKPVYEQVYVDRATDTFYSEKCKKRPENVYRIPRSVALMQGFTEAACR